MKDIFELAKEEKEKRDWRISQALCDGIPERGYDRVIRSVIADGLYHARYDGRHYQDIPTKEEILETFCWNVFGASLEEVLKAWDKYLG